MSQVDPRRYKYRTRRRDPVMKNWNVDEEVTLLRLYAEDKTRKEISEYMNRTVNSVHARLVLLKAERVPKSGKPCGRCGEPCIKECGLTYCESCGWESEESKGVIIIG